jgi:methylglutaconyl-CoA hydratase
LNKTTMNHLLLDVDGHCATVTLNRPDVRNAFNDEVIAELTQVFRGPGRAHDRALHRAGCQRHGVLCGRRPQLDAPPWPATHATQNRADAAALAAMLRTVFECPKPTIARVQGDVLCRRHRAGGGL